MSKRLMESVYVSVCARAYGYVHTSRRVLASMCAHECMCGPLSCICNFNLIQFST